jgi:N6-adenosine-specific RNA methylase IME4
MKYRTIVADPPWSLPDRFIRTGRRREIPYEFMSPEAIKALPVARFAADDAVLWLWSPRRDFREGHAAAVARAWGFEPVGEIIWGLRNPGLGGFLGNDHEPVLIARRGAPKFMGDIRCGGVHFWRQTYLNGGKAHSAKPEAFIDFVEMVSPGPYLEMFARRHRLGWDVWGNESANTATLGAAI